ncbi:MAG: alpha/beta fold hydrolase, partial [Myxococcota bacterium]
GQRFVAVPDPGAPAWANPLGKGAPVVVRSAEDAALAVEEALDAIGIDALLADHGPRVALKTTFMGVSTAADRSPAVSPAVLAAVRASLARRGASVEVLEAPNLYGRFHEGRSVEAVARYLGVARPVYDAQADQVHHDYLRGVGEDTVSARWRDADVRLLLGKLRTHPTTGIVGGLDAAEGLGVRNDDLVFLDRRAERHTASLMVLDAFPAHAALVDAHDAVPDGLMGFFGTTHPIHPRRVYASRDAVALDVVLARHCGADPDDESLTVRHAIDWFGDPRPVAVDGADLPIAGLRLPSHGRRTALLAQLAWPVWATAGLRGALFLPPFDEAAFPPRDPSPVVAALQRAVRRVVDDDVVRVEVPGLLPTRFDPVGEARVRVADVGEGPVTVFLHGYPDTLQIWANLVPRVSGRRIAFDWPGLGYSDPLGDTMGPDALADHLAGLLTAWGVPSARIVGHDMGGQAALVFAARHPERCSEVVVMNSLLFGDGATSWEIAVMRRGGLADAAFRWLPGVVYERCVRSFVDGPLPDALDADFRGAFAHTRARLGPMCRAYDRALPELPRRYFEIRCPVRVGWAEREAHFPRSHGDRLGHLLGAPVTEIAGARHWMAWTHPDAVAALVEGRP